MKKKILLAVLLTALFLAPFSAFAADPAAAEETNAAFTVDETKALQGMGRSLLQGYAESLRGERWNLILPVRSDTAVGQVTAELLTPDATNSFFRTREIVTYAREEEKGVWGIRFSVPVFPELKNADYACVIRVTGKNAEGNDLAAEIPWTIRVRGNQQAAEKVRMEIGGVQADLAVGEDGEILVTLANPCAAANFENIELKIADSTGQILPRGAEMLRVGTLAAGQCTTVSYPVTVTEKATVAPHVLKADVSFTALDQTVTCTANHTVSVRQEIRLEQGGVKMPAKASAGDAVTVTLPVMNMGRADLVNVLATVSLPGITERQSVLVGTIQPGETKQAQLMLTTAKDTIGDFSGTILVECTDGDGNEASFSLPLALTLQAPVKPAADAEGTAETAQKQSSPLIPGLAGGCGLLLFALLLQGILLRRKLHRLEEEKL